MTIIQVWIIHHLQIIGEAASAMSQNFIADYPEIPWQDMSDFRNILVHEYFRVDTEIVWNVTTKELPDLKNKVRSMSE